MADLNDREQRLLLHMREMSGWLLDALTPDDHNTMTALKQRGLVETVGEGGGQRRHVFTAAGQQAAEQLASR